MTELMQRQLVEEEDSCLYWGTSHGKDNERVAINFCGGFRGVLTSASDYFIINPLPGSVGRVRRAILEGEQGRHVIFRRPRWKKSCPHRSHRVDTSPLLLQHDNQIDDFHSFKARGLPSLKEDDLFRSRDETSKTAHVELAIFVDRDLHKYMEENFPEDTDEHVIQVVLAMINAVQLLYSDPTLGAKVEFLIKRLEILQTDPRDLARSYNIDRYLASFCEWQRGENAVSDEDPLHWDHAVILTGLDVHVVDRDKKVSAQVVGLAPVAGMCEPGTSCTVNEGRHFESVYVMAHEIGHNLGMRHDGREASNSCSPGSHIMSPTLGSGKITWSECSRAYLQRFLDSPQASCLWDPGPAEISHSLRPPSMPGERFPADVQCRLRYGPDSYHSPQQSNQDLCRDLHCRQESC